MTVDNAVTMPASRLGRSIGFLQADQERSLAVAIALAFDLDLDVLRA